MACAKGGARNAGHRKRTLGRGGPLDLGPGHGPAFSLGNRIDRLSLTLTIGSIASTPGLVKPDLREKHVFSGGHFREVKPCVDKLAARKDKRDNF